MVDIKSLDRARQSPRGYDAIVYQEDDYTVVDDAFGGEIASELIASSATVIQAGIDAIPIQGTLMFMKGYYPINTALVSTDGKCLVSNCGEYGVRLYGTAAINEILDISSGDSARIANIFFYGNTNATNLLKVTGGLTTVQNCYFQSALSSSILCSNGWNQQILNCRSYNSALYGIRVESGFVNSVIDGFESQDTNGIFLGADTQRSEGVRITNCLIAPPNGRGIYLHTCLEVEITNCIIDQCKNGGIRIESDSDYIKIRDCYISCDNSVNNLGVPVWIEFDATNVVISGNTINASYYYGIGIVADALRAPHSIIISDNLFQNNDIGDIINDSGHNILITNNKLESGGYSIAETATHDDPTGVVTGNIISGAIIRRSSTIWRDNIGYVTKNHGSATILNGNATIVVAHGLAGTPVTIRATGTTADTSALYIDTIGAANFTINAAGAVGGDRTVYWEAEY